MPRGGDDRPVHGYYVICEGLAGEVADDEEAEEKTARVQHFRSRKAAVDAVVLCLPGFRSRIEKAVRNKPPSREYAFTSGGSQRKVIMGPIMYEDENDEEEEEEEQGEVEDEEGMEQHDDEDLEDHMQHQHEEGEEAQEEEEEKPAPAKAKPKPRGGKAAAARVKGKAKPKGRPRKAKAKAKQEEEEEEQEYVEDEEHIAEEEEEGGEVRGRGRGQAAAAAAAAAASGPLPQKRRVPPADKEPEAPKKKKQAKLKAQEAAALDEYGMDEGEDERLRAAQQWAQGEAERQLMEGGKLSTVDAISATFRTRPKATAMSLSAVLRHTSEDVLREVLSAWGWAGGESVDDMDEKEIRKICTTHMQRLASEVPFVNKPHPKEPTRGLLEYLNKYFSKLAQYAQENLQQH
ncbi:unnamed protein product [Vitrella brassicaformis CCMP3155]|uniref:Uncharacterized protein n=1 Tax=Vitrella brassicaformis (strain CCMP3155) TaxID=1169540 RepID=A0A0G4GFS0_VITBC|nr:unnamed protein product [Vitrella brassicaformis CCMP3155]|eukprot:CEM28355.1 unnamed protein product [Vitrella brassicaformis CCMP3155]